MRPEQIRFSYTNPITGQRVSRDTGKRFVEIDDVVLEVEHTYRGRGLWTASAYSDHLDPRAVLEWIEAGNLVFLFAHRRSDLVTKLAEYVTTDEWAAKRKAWLALPKAKRWR